MKKSIIFVTVSVCLAGSVRLAVAQEHQCSCGQPNACAATEAQSASLKTAPGVFAAEDAQYQKSEQYIAQLREEFRRNKADLVERAMDLNPEEAEIFWRIYAEYDRGRTAIGDRRLALLRDYIEHFNQMTNVKAQELTAKHFAVQKDLLELRRVYVKKYQTLMNPIIAGRFLQVELQTQLLLDLAISANLPLIEKAAD